MPRKSADTVPTHPQLFRAEVLRSGPLTPNLHRVTITGAALADFPWRGYDHWFRLFLRLPHQDDFQLPELSGTGWWRQYRLLPKARRPHCANYTVGGFRAAEREMDIDFVVHRDSAGQLEGSAAIWAIAAQPGEQLALLDQGILFDRPADATEVLIVADETGLPAVSGILRSLPRETLGRVLQEVPTALDRRDFDGPPGVRVTWLTRDDPALVGGVTALEAVRALTAVDPAGYAFVVGESTLATSARRHLHRLGLPKDRITFSGFWKH
jgi:NADPH-dependent ferric siderophore reductase